MVISFRKIKMRVIKIIVVSFTVVLALGTLEVIIFWIFYLIFCFMELIVTEINRFFFMNFAHQVFLKVTN